MPFLRRYASRGVLRGTENEYGEGQHTERSTVRGNQHGTEYGAWVVPPSLAHHCTLYLDVGDRAEPCSAFHGTEQGRLGMKMCYPEFGSDPLYSESGRGNHWNSELEFREHTKVRTADGQSRVVLCSADRTSSFFRKYFRAALPEDNFTSSGKVVFRLVFLPPCLPS